MRFFRLVLPAFFFASCATVRLPSVEIKKNAPEGSSEWKEMVSQTLEKHPDLLAARANVRSSRYARNIAAGEYLPEVEGVLNRTRTQEDGSGAEESLSVGLTTSQSLFTGFGTTGNTIQNHKDYQAAKWVNRETSADIRFRLRTSYVELLKLHKLLGVDQKIVDRRAQNAELIKLRYEAGREHLGSSLRADAIVEQASFDVRQTERRIQNESLRLGRELGGDFSLDFQIIGELEDMLPKSNQIVPDYVKLAGRTPQVRRFVKEAEAAKAAIVTAQSVIWPQIDGTYENTQTGVRASQLDRETFLGLRISLPFFNGGENVQGVLKAKADYDAAREAARSIRDETVADLSQAWISFMDAVELVEVNRQFLEAERKRSEIVRAQYSSGLSDFQDFDSAESDLAQSERTYVQSLADALLQQANWELAKGSTLEEVLHGS